MPSINELQIKQSDDNNAKTITEQIEIINKQIARYTGEIEHIQPYYLYLQQI